MSLLGGSLSAKNELDITPGVASVNMSVVVGCLLDADNRWLAVSSCFMGPAKAVFVNIHFLIDGAMFGCVSWGPGPCEC